MRTKYEAWLLYSTRLREDFGGYIDDVRAFSAEDELKKAATSCVMCKYTYVECGKKNVNNRSLESTSRTRIVVIHHHTSLTMRKNEHESWSLTFLAFSSLRAIMTVKTLLSYTRSFSDPLLQ